MTIIETLNKYKKELEAKGYNVLYIGLYGSQNYNLDDEKSDIDARAIILPTLHDIIFRVSTSKSIEFEEGCVDVKDLITYYDVIKKGNFSFVEPMDTEHYIGDTTIRDMFQLYRPNYLSIVGAMYEKRKALDHEYPSKKEEFERWGFDPKQLHHIFRLNDLLKHNIKHNKSLSYLVYGEYYDKDKTYTQKSMVDIKRDYKLPLSKAIEDAEYLINQSRNLIPEGYKYDIINIDEQIFSYIESKVKEML